jgi:H+/Cl- antiporter ClcA
MTGALVVCVFAAVGGALTGVVSYAFLHALDWATETRLEHGWLQWLLPLAGAVVAGTYHRWGGRAKGGTPYVIEQSHIHTHGVPARMAPFIFAGSTLGHLFGASVGREGAALQMAGSVTDTIARGARLSRQQRRTLVAASLAGGWGGVFAVPFTGVVFALQVCRGHRVRTLVPAVVSAFTATWVVRLLGYELSDRPRLPKSEWTLGLPFKFALFGIAVGLLARLFVATLKRVKRRSARWFHRPTVRAAAGGVATIALVWLFGTGYVGLSTPMYSTAIAGGAVDWWQPLLKLLFTAVALGTGYVGGEVLPLFVMGATLGGTLAPALGANGSLLAATGAPAAFASAASVAITGVVLSVEQFGSGVLVPALIVGLFARLAAGRPGLYRAH